MRARPLFCLKKTHDVSFFCFNSKWPFIFNVVPWVFFLNTLIKISLFSSSFLSIYLLFKHWKTFIPFPLFPPLFFFSTTTTTTVFLSRLPPAFFPFPLTRVCLASAETQVVIIDKRWLLVCDKRSGRNMSTRQNEQHTPLHTHTHTSHYRIQ